MARLWGRRTSSPKKAATKFCFINRSRYFLEAKHEKAFFTLITRAHNPFIAASADCAHEEGKCFECPSLIHHPQLGASRRASDKVSRSLFGLAFRSIVLLLRHALDIIFITIINDNLQSGAVTLSHYMCVQYESAEPRNERIKANYRNDSSLSPKMIIIRNYRCIELSLFSVSSSLRRNLLSYVGLISEISKIPARLCRAINWRREPKPRVS